MTTNALTQTQTLAEVESVLRGLLPPGWTLAVERRPVGQCGWRPDVMLSIASSAGERVVFVGEAKPNGDARQISDALDHLRSHLDAVSDTRPMFIAPWLSARARQALAD
nr:hypothetical protein [Euzebyaceae bacterium]